MPSEQQTPNERLATFVRSHGLKARLEQDWIVFPDYGRRMSASVVQRTPAEKGISIQLEIRLELWPGRLMTETFEGIGPSEVEALGDAIRNFSLGSLHVLLAAFFGIRYDDLVSGDHWMVGGVRRDVVVSRETRRGVVPKDDPDWYRGLSEATNRLGLAEGTHWIRAFIGRNGNEPLVCEVTLDGAPWEAMEAELSRLPWRPVEGLVTSRRFLIIRGGLDVGEAVGTIAGQAKLEDAVLNRLLISRGLSPRDASRAVAFVPLAFGRVLLGSLGVKFGDTVEVETKRGRRELNLADEAVFVEATRLATEAFSTGAMSKDLFSAVALRSSEVTAVNHALDGGARAEELVTTPPVITLAEGMAPVAKEKPWWKIW
jgi:hypothetical protein